MMTLLHYQGVFLLFLISGPQVDDALPSTIKIGELRQTSSAFYAPTQQTVRIAGFCCYLLGLRVFFSRFRGSD